MANEKVLNEKKAVVDALTQRLQNAVAGVFVDYKGINVLEDTALRAEMRENNVNYTVIKNTLARFAINNVGFSELDSILNGTTSLATSDEDPIAPFRIKLTSKNDLISIVLGTMQAPIAGLACVLDQIAEKGGAAAAAPAEEAAEAPAEAPAEEAAEAPAEAPAEEAAEAPAAE